MAKESLFYKRDSSQTSLKAKFSFCLKKFIPFVEFVPDCSVKWTEGILKIPCEADDLVSTSFAFPVVDFPFPLSFPRFCLQILSRRGAESGWRLRGSTAQKPFTLRTGKGSVSWMWCCLYLSSLHTGASFHSREIIKNRKRDHVLSTFCILGALVCMLPYFL